MLDCIVIELFLPEYPEIRAADQCHEIAHTETLSENYRKLQDGFPSR